MPSLTFEHNVLTLNIYKRIFFILLSKPFLKKKWVNTHIEAFYGLLSWLFPLPSPEVKLRSLGRFYTSARVGVVFNVVLFRMIHNKPLKVLAQIISLLESKSAPFQTRSERF